MNNETEIKTLVGSDFAPEVINEIENAKSSIKIVVFDWRWYSTEIGSNGQKFNSAIIESAKRGVDVKVITNNVYTIQILKEQGINAKKLATGRLVHVKLMIIDETDVIIGSHNYTQSAMTTNYEFSVLIKQCPEIQRYLDFFVTLFK